ncbi:MAG: SufD family Fe-S cluster assembly protein, partial [Chitinophagaceae bacterium]
MDTLNFFKEHFDHLQFKDANSGLDAIRKRAFQQFNEKGIPAGRNEEWKYTRIGGLFNKEYDFFLNAGELTPEELDDIRLPGYEQANELVFINGVFAPSLSVVRSKELVAMRLEEAAHSEFKEIVATHLGHSSSYLKDGINALNTAFVHGGVFIYVKKGKLIEHPVYMYHISDARSGNIFSQPRSLVFIGENAQVQLVETSSTIGQGESFTNGVMEIVVEKEAVLEHYKIQNDAEHTSQVSTTHIHQTGKSYIHAVTLTLYGGIVRNNLNVVMDAEYAEAHLYGLYFLKGRSHVDNHTL